jgi:hypothetical protein
VSFGFRAEHLPEKRIPKGTVEALARQVNAIGVRVLSVRLKGNRRIKRLEMFAKLAAFARQ